MPKPVRQGITCDRIARGRRVFCEALNPHFGYFYTVRESVKKATTPYQRIELVDTDEFGKVLLLDDIIANGEHEITWLMQGKKVQKITDDLTDRLASIGAVIRSTSAIASEWNWPAATDAHFRVESTQ